MDDWSVFVNGTIQALCVVVIVLSAMCIVHSLWQRYWNR